MKEENKLKELKKYGKIYMLKKYCNEVKDIKAIFVDYETNEEAAKKMKLKILE